MKTQPRRCACGSDPEVTSPGYERNCWMVMCTNCRRNGPSVIDPGGRDYAVVGWNLGLDHHFLLGAIGEDWHFFPGKPHYEYTRSEAADSPPAVDVNTGTLRRPAGDSGDQLRQDMTAEQIVEYALAKGDPDLLWLARLHTGQD